MPSQPIKRKKFKEDNTVSKKDKQSNMDFSKFSSLTFQDNYLISGGPYANSNFTVKALYRLSCICFKPMYVLLDHFLCMFIATTVEGTQAKSKNIAWFFIKMLFTIVFLICVIPMGFIAFAIWFPLQLLRPRPYSYICPSGTSQSTESIKYERISPHDSTGPQSSCVSSNVVSSLDSNLTTYSVVSANLCLMPHFIARINNLSDGVSRGKKIAAYLSGDTHSSTLTTTTKSTTGATKLTEMDFLVPTWSSDSLNVEGYEKIAGDSIDSFSVTSTQWSVTSKERAVSDTFPGPADFLCLQEVSDSRATKQLLKGLRQKYPYIIYDVTWPIHNYRMTLLGSGLCIASRHPFIDVNFKAFRDGNRDDKLACKGLLMTKVFLGKSPKGEDQVGYLATTHLQAWSHLHASNARCKQLSLIDIWMEEFIVRSRKLDSKIPEIVLFNVITGDFNFDKSSHFDHNEQTCSFIQNFRDPCIDDNGAQYSWVVGTELNQKKMHDECVRTPQGLQKMLISELERSQYVASTVPTKSTQRQSGDGKRRIDYILYKDCQDIDLVVRDYKFFTGLTTLTDHIPVGMVFSCELGNPPAKVEVKNS